MPLLKMQTRESWSAACDEVAQELLRNVGCLAPPVDAEQLRSMLGDDIAFAAGGGARDRWHRIGRRPDLSLPTHDRPESRQWAAAHELGLSLATRLFQRPGAGGGFPGGCERTASRIAEGILLPRPWFLRDALRWDGDVLRLQRRYSTASLELILSGLLRLKTLTMVSVFESGALILRRTNGRLSPPPLLALERRLQRESHATGRPACGTARGARVQIWPVHVAGAQRELLRTTPAGEEAATARRLIRTGTSAIGGPAFETDAATGYARRL